jgi:methylmalonyl-CoA mutase
MRYARNIQHLLKSESFLNQTLDPAGGSYYIENLTQELREKAWDKFCHIEENGGINELHKNGEILKMIQADAAVQKDTLMAENKIMVGVNRHKPDTHSEVISKDNRLAKEFES